MSRPETLQQSLPGLWRILIHFWPQVRKHRLLIAGSLTALFAEIGLRLLEPWPLKFVFDHVIGSIARSNSAFVARLARFEPGTLLTFAALAVVAITGLRALAAYWNTIGFAKLGNRVLTRIRTQLYRHVQYLSLSFHTKARTGDLVVRLISDVGMLQDVVVTAFLPMMARLFILAGMVALMFWLNWQLALLALAVFPLFWLRTVTLG
ncbi:MAG TPA: ABC transporter transmembrane domain-containing protein, partial [Candidatus Binatia bacterium]|nr:ABC transporter transmembrane domain-containing protein [Candidatus Binatia bacterium]